VGWDTSVQEGRDACIGVVTAGGSTFSNLEEDCNDASYMFNLLGGTGTFTAFDANGRGSAILLIGVTNFQYTLYMVSSSRCLVVSADPNPALSGEMQQQSLPANGGGFTQSTLDGNVVFHLSGLSGAGSGSAVSVETAAADGVSSLDISVYEDRLGIWQGGDSPLILNCTYSVAPNGRVTLSGLPNGCAGSSPILHLTGTNAGFLLDVALGVDTGTLEPQSAGPFSLTSLSGSFATGTSDVVGQGAQMAVGVTTLDGQGGITTTYSIVSTSNATPNATTSDTYAINPDGTLSTGSSNGQTIGVVTSTSKFVMLDPECIAASWPSLLSAEK
jgi:hypothetical protein